MLVRQAHPDNYSRLKDEEAATQMGTNFFGPYRLNRATFSSFRTHKTGTIVNITRIAGIDGHPACGLYAASRFALEGV
ncbi:hypothetical protein N7G274_008828 [Stereocaulon virgatum]|uniref:Uncharacterized protein n=1 Tax=Stereocaulon virgatum TaxID=373712 RepID=A0ABR3ZXS6_9LECA